MIDHRFPQDRPLASAASSVAILAFGLLVLACVGFYQLGRYHERRDAVERHQAFERQAKHWQRK